MRSRFPRGALLVGLLFVALLAGALLPQTIFAQTANDQQRAELQSQLDALETQIAANQAVVDSLDAQGKSLSSEVTTLNAKIKAAQLQVQATQIAIQQLNSNITIQQKTITTLGDKLDAEKESLAEILRATDQLDHVSVVEVALSSQDLSTLLGDFDSYALLKQSLGDSYTQITGTTLESEAEKEQLETQLTQQQQVAQLQLAAKAQVQQQQTTKQQLLTQTKGQESQYQSLVASQQKTAAQIRAALFALAGGGGTIPLPTAISDAQEAQKLTGVQASFILGILSQESDLGANVGQCYVTDLTTGDGTGNSEATSGVMKSPRDTVPFKEIMDALGRNWQTTAVSCPQGNGYGGAMGPTQFLPSTWLNLEGQIDSALGIASADPWNPVDAITATGIYLAADGGAGSDYTAQHTAAAKYYAGGAWASAGQVYANSVMSKAAEFQQDINTLAGS